MLWVDASFQTTLYSAAPDVPVHEKVRAANNAKNNTNPFFIHLPP